MDVFVLNKSDRPESDALWAALCSMLDARAHDAPADRWRPPVVRTVASAGTGVAELLQAILDHGRHLGARGGLPRRRLARMAGGAGENA